MTVPLAPPLAAAGRASYAANCAPCHGEQGLGDGPTAAELPGPPTAFADPAAVWDQSPGMLFHTTKFGRLQALMPPWSNRLNDGEIWDTVAFAWSLHTSAAETEAGATLYGQVAPIVTGIAVAAMALTLKVNYLISPIWPPSRS